MEFINFLIETKQQQRFLSTNYVSHMIVRKQKRLPSEYVGWASIEDLPNEIILKILSYVKIKDLHRCMAVNKRMRDIANDTSLWKRIHLEGRASYENMSCRLNQSFEFDLRKIGN